MPNRYEIDQNKFHILILVSKNYLTVVSEMVPKGTIFGTNLNTISETTVNYLLKN